MKLDNSKVTEIKMVRRYQEYSLLSSILTDNQPREQVDPNLQHLSQLAAKQQTSNSKIIQQTSLQETRETSYPS